jgi:hypothetical protein
VVIEVVVTQIREDSNIEIDAEHAPLVKAMARHLKCHRSKQTRLLFNAAGLGKLPLKLRRRGRGAPRRPGARPRPRWTMPRNWDQTLKEWAETIHATDEARGSAAQKAITAAVRASEPLAKKGFVPDVFVTGSYRNNTNIRAGSDVDVAVVLRDVVYYDLPADGSLTREMLGIRDSDHTFAAFRDDIGAALRAHFDKPTITQGDKPTILYGDKAFNVRASGDRLEADVAVFFEHRRYPGKKIGTEWEHHKGVEMRSRRDPARRIVNWPEQHHTRGAAKNDATGRRFKRMVRILKHLTADMEQGTLEQRSAAGQVSSFGLECLAFNAPDDCFHQQEGGYLLDLRALLTWLGTSTRPKADAGGFVEVSGMEKLFRAATGRTQEQAYAFARAAWARVFEQEPLPW